MIAPQFAKGVKEVPAYMNTLFIFEGVKAILFPMGLLYTAQYAPAPRGGPYRVKNLYTGGRLRRRVPSAHTADGRGRTSRCSRCPPWEESHAFTP